MVSTNSLMTVRVIDCCGTPLMPTSRLGKVRRMLDSGEAEIVCYFPFTIKLRKKVEKVYIQPISVGLDEGTAHVGVSVTTEKKELFSMQLETRSKDIKLNLLERASYRRGRRSRNLRHRKARFLNRKASKKPGWIPPTQKHIVASNVNAVRIALKYLPSPKLIQVETGKFDTQKLVNPDIEGEEYQQGLMCGFDNVKEFVKWRDGYRCRQCNGKSGSTNIHAHHMWNRAKGGPSHPANYVTLCELCHHDVHSGKITLKNFDFGPLTKKTLASATAMNVIADRVIDELKRTYPNSVVMRTFGYITKALRKRYNIEKSHTNDALVISENCLAVPCETAVFAKQVRRHNRQIHKANPSKGGIRKMNQTVHFVKGFALNDYVILDGKSKGFITGRMKTGYAIVKTFDGERIHEKNVVSMKRLKLLRHHRSIIYEFKER